MSGLSRQCRNMMAIKGKKPTQYFCPVGILLLPQRCDGIGSLLGGVQRKSQILQNAGEFFRG